MTQLSKPSGCFPPTPRTLESSVWFSSGILNQHNVSLALLASCALEWRVSFRFNCASHSGAPGAGSCLPLWSMVCHTPPSSPHDLRGSLGLHLFICLALCQTTRLWDQGRDTSHIRQHLPQSTPQADTMVNVTQKHMVRCGGCHGGVVPGLRSMTAGVR